MDKTIIMKIFAGPTLIEIGRKFNEWKNFVNDDNYYSIIEQNLVSGNKEYMLTIRYYKTR